MLTKQPRMILPVFLTYFLTGGANEEWRWRGFALEPTQLKWGALKASGLLGLIWGAWLLPLLFSSEHRAALQDLINLPRCISGDHYAAYLDLQCKQRKSLRSLVPACGDWRLLGNLPHRSAAG